MDEEKNDLYLESKISETIIKKKTNEEKKLKVCKKNNLLLKYIYQQKNVNILFKVKPWNQIYSKDQILNFLKSDKHIETFDMKFQMDKFFIYNFLVNYELNDIPKEVSEFMIDLFFKNKKIKTNSNVSLSSNDISEEDEIDYDKPTVEKEFFDEYNIEDEDEIHNEFNDILNEEKILNKIDTINYKTNESGQLSSIKDLSNENNSNHQLNNKNGNENENQNENDNENINKILNNSNISVLSGKNSNISKLDNFKKNSKKISLESKMDSLAFASNINKFKTTYNNEKIEDTIAKIENKKKILDNFFTKNVYIDKKLEILRFMKNNDIECFNIYDFDVVDNTGNKVISDENIDMWYSSFKQMETRKKSIFNPSLLIISIVLMTIEYGAKYFNIKEFEGISKNFSEDTVPQDLLSTKEYLDEHVSKHIPSNPFFDFGIYLTKTYLSKKMF